MLPRGLASVLNLDEPASPEATLGGVIRPARDALAAAVIAIFLIGNVIILAFVVLRGSLLSAEHEHVEDLAAQTSIALAAQLADNPDGGADLAAATPKSSSVASVRVFSLQGKEIRPGSTTGEPLKGPTLSRIRSGLDEVEATLPDFLRTPRSLVGYAPVHGSRGAIERIVAIELDLGPTRAAIGWLLAGAVGAFLISILAIGAFARFVFRSRSATLDQLSARERARLADRQTADGVAQFIQQNPTPHLAFDGDDLVQANLAAARTFGAGNVDELRRTPLWQLWPRRQPDGSFSAEAWSEHVHQALTESVAHFEWTFCRADESPLEMDVFLSRATLERRDLLLLACYDLSEIRRAQAQLVVSEQRFRDVSDAVGEFIWEVDLAGRYTFVSPRVQEVLGRPPAEVLGRHPFEWLPPDDSGGTVERSDQIVESGEAFRNFEHRIRRSDGEILWISASGVPRFDDEGTLVGYRGASLDISASRRHQQELLHQKEAAEAAAQTKSAFLAMMSHEIRTPLNSVLGFADLILQTPLDDLQREYLDTIQRSGDALLVLLNDILDFSKIESGRLAVEFAATDLRRCLDDVVDLYLPTSHARDVGLIADLDPDVPRYLRTDPARLRQILINLVGNAVKFTPTGSVLVRVGLAQSAEAPAVRFEVTDTGIGISAEKMRHLFQPFSQADTSTTRRFGGTGLGLAISKRLAALLEGDIGIADSSEKGTTFFLEIPLVVPSEGEIAEISARTPVAKAKDLVSRKPLRVLVVDDNPINRRLTTQLLGLLGDDSGSVASASECFAEIAAGSYDVILMDVQMPDIDGLEATRMIREGKGTAEHQTIPIVALTAGAMSEDREACFAAGMDFYLTKPIRRSALDEVLRKIGDQC